MLKFDLIAELLALYSLCFLADGKGFGLIDTSEILSPTFFFNLLISIYGLFPNKN
jgi:hypothetical protein